MTAGTRVLLAAVTAPMVAALGCQIDPRSDPDPGANQSQGIPQFEVDPTWPNPLPNQWIIGEVQQTVEELDKAMAELRFDAAANTIYHFTSMIKSIYS